MGWLKKREAMVEEARREHQHQLRTLSPDSRRWAIGSAVT